MVKLGHHEHKLVIIQHICTVLQKYFANSYRDNTVEFKVVFEIIDQNYFKIINKICNVGSPQVQHAYKGLMCELFKYILPKGNYDIINDNNSFLKIKALDIDVVTKEFKTLMYTHKKLKFKELHTYYGNMKIEEFREFMLTLVKVSEIESKVELVDADEFFEINPY